MSARGGRGKGAVANRSAIADIQTAAAQVQICANGVAEVGVGVAFTASVDEREKGEVRGGAGVGKGSCVAFAEMCAQHAT